MDQDEEYSNTTKNRATREEVRRRNREVMEKANAELRESRVIPSTSQSGVGKKDYSRLSLLQQVRSGSQSFHCDYQFHTSTPELELGPLRVDVNVDSAKFTELNLSSASNLFNECLRSICLLDETSIAYLDLLNPEECYNTTSTGVLDRADEALLHNELSSTQNDMPDETAGAYTGHFLRKPQLMSNDLFTEGGRQNGSRRYVMTNVGIQPNDVIDEVANEFEQVKLIDSKFNADEAIQNDVTKTTLRARRVLPLLPDDIFSQGTFTQFKFDESFPVVPFGSIMTTKFDMYEPNREGSDEYIRKRKYSHLNKASDQKALKEEFYLLRLPSDTGSCQLKHLGNKILLKRDLRVIDGDVDKIKLIRR